jgi:hypothetical protein
MSKHKGNEWPSNWQHWQRPDAPPSFRRFHQYPFDQVLEVALMLYPRATIKPGERFDWLALVQLALAWLDNLHDAYESVVILSRGKDADKNREALRTEKRDKELKGLPSLVPYDQAACKVMRDRHHYAVSRFESFVQFCRPLLRRKFKATPNQLLKHWRKEGIPLDVVRLLYLAHECYREGKPTKKRERGLPKKIQDQANAFKTALDDSIR